MSYANQQSQSLSNEQKALSAQILAALVADYISKDFNLSVKESLAKFYKSKLASKLENYDTLLYR